MFTGTSTHFLKVVLALEGIVPAESAVKHQQGCYLRIMSFRWVASGSKCHFNKYLLLHC
jgi:hypothetical protein